MTDHRPVIRPNPRLARIATTPEQGPVGSEAPQQRSGRVRLRVAGAAVVIVAIVIAFAVIGIPQATHAARPAPPFDLAGLDGTGRIRLADHLGTPVLINFWASWCTPCREEMPELEELSQRFRGQLVVIGIDMNDDPAKARSLASELSITYPLVVDDSNDTVRAYDVTVVPSSMFVTAEGTLVARSSGKPSKQQLEEMLSEYFGLPAAAPGATDPSPGIAPG